MTIVNFHKDSQHAEETRNPLDRLAPAPARPLPANPIAPWLRSWGAFRATAVLFLRRNGYRLGAVVLFLPIYLARCVKYAPRGFGRLIARFSKWIYDSDTAFQRHEHAVARDTPEAQRAHQMRRANLHARFLVVSTILATIAAPVMIWLYPRWLAGGLGVLVCIYVVKLIKGKSVEELIVGSVVGLGVYFGAMWVFERIVATVPLPPLWTVWVLGGLTLVGLGEIGRPTGQKLVRPGDVHTGGVVEKPTADMVIEALCRIGVPGMTLDKTDRVKEEVRVRHPGVARSARGYNLELELPPGITAAMVMDKREPLAGATRRKLGTVWPSKGPDHPGHLKLHLSDVPMATAPQSAWPLAKGNPIDIFEPFALVTDQEGEWLEVQTEGTHIVVAGASGFGKSVLLRQLACAFALDPRARIYCFDGKISGDLDPVRKVAHAYYEGAEPEDVQEQLAALRGLEQEMRRRSRFLRDLPSEERSTKVTSALASKYKGLAPIVVMFDELQEYTEYGTKGVKPEMKIREEFRTIITRISRLGRSAGIRMVLVSQKPDADVLPTAIMGNCSVRICFKVTEQNHNDQVLGTGAYKAGLKATLFSTEDRGLAWLKAAGDPRVVRSWSAMVELEPARALIEKAYRLRVDRGLLTGQAAGELEVPAEPQGDLLDDAYEVVQENRCRNTSLEQLREGLTLLRPGIWGHLDNEALGGMLRQAGVIPQSIHCPAEGRSMRGVKVDWITDAIDLRDGSDLTEDGENLTAG